MQYNKHKNIILLLILFVISFSVYINSLHGEFLIDDTTGILNNADIHNLKDFFTKHLQMRTGSLDAIIRALLWHIGGGNTFVFHLFFVMAHCGCVLLIFMLCQRLFKNTNLSFLTAIIFAIHPIHTEGVSWISAGPYVLAAFLYLAAFLFYINPDKPNFNVFMAMVFFVLCFLTSNAAASLPFMFLAYDLFFRPKEEDKIKGYKNIRRILVYSIIIIALLNMAMFLLMRRYTAHTILVFRGYSYLIVIVKAIAYYMKIIYLPIVRALYHPFGYTVASTGRTDLMFFIGVSIIGLSLFLFLRYRKKFIPLSFAVAFFYISYLPYSNIVPICNIVSERYIYLASFGFCLFLSALFMKVWEIINRSQRLRGFLRITAMTALVLFLLCYAILTFKHNKDFKDIYAYWYSNINNFPEGYMAYNNLAGTFYASGNIKAAIEYSWINLMINPKQPHVWCNLGMAYRQQNDLKMAVFCYEEALKIDKGFLPAHKALEGIKKQKK